MSTEKHFTYPSADKKTQIHAIRWEPEGEIRGIVQIAHGMQEYIDRYADFARFLNGHGFLVVGNDHLGHGSSVTSPDKMGYFAAKNGNKAVIDKWLEGHPYLKQYAEAHGTTYLIHYDIDMSATDFGDQLIDEKGTVICQGDCFEMPHTFRITLSHAEDLEEGLRRIDEFLEEKAAIYGRLSEK